MARAKKNTKPSLSNPAIESTVDSGTRSGRVHRPSEQQQELDDKKAAAAAKKQEQAEKARQKAEEAKTGIKKKPTPRKKPVQAVGPGGAPSGSIMLKSVSLVQNGPATSSALSAASTPKKTYSAVVAGSAPAKVSSKGAGTVTMTHTGAPGKLSANGLAMTGPNPVGGVPNKPSMLAAATKNMGTAGKAVGVAKTSQAAGKTSEPVRPLSVAQQASKAPVLGTKTSASAGVVRVASTPSMVPNPNRPNASPIGKKIYAATLVPHPSATTPTPSAPPQPPAAATSPPSLRSVTPQPRPILFTPPPTVADPRKSSVTRTVVKV
ncbi:hypothetical protein K474DRAFT_1713362 [Panus rudis PR-1116 ss-1]|nr:hypothetical protein K474DRAFT_1713362 [Panus rudis PR-1116 ss-1]